MKTVNSQGRDHC